MVGRHCGRFARRWSGSGRGGRGAGQRIGRGLRRRPGCHHLGHGAGRCPGERCGGPPPGRGALRWGGRGGGLRDGRRRRSGHRADPGGRRRPGHGRGAGPGADRDAGGVAVGRAHRAQSDRAPVRGGHRDPAVGGRGRRHRRADSGYPEDPARVAGAGEVRGPLRRRGQPPDEPGRRRAHQGQPRGRGGLGDRRDRGGPGPAARPGNGGGGGRPGPVRPGRWPPGRS